MTPTVYRPGQLIVVSVPVPGLARLELEVLRVGVQTLECQMSNTRTPCRVNITDVRYISRTPTVRIDDITFFP